MPLSMKHDKAEARRERLIEKYRDCNVDFFAQEDAKQIIAEHEHQMARLGIWFDPKAVHWSVGYRNDGTNYPWYVDDHDMSKFLRRHALVKEFPAIWWWCRRARQAWSLRGERIHCGGNQSYISVDAEDTMYQPVAHAEAEDDSGLLAGILRVKQDDADGEWPAFEERVKGIMRDHMADLHKELEDAYEYLTSDEAVWETIEANEWDQDDDPEEDEDDD